MGEYRPELADVLEYCKSDGNELPSSLKQMDQAARRKCIPTFRKYTKRFFYNSKDGNLYYQHGKNDVTRTVKVLITRKDVEAALTQVHGNDTEGPHMGIKRTQTAMTQRFYWRSMSEDIKAWVANCRRCRTVPPKVKRTGPPRHPIYASTPWEIICIDIFGPLPASSPEGYKYILAATCVFSGWVEAEPLVDKSAQSVFNIFIKLFYRWGLPKRIITGGEESNNTILKELMLERYGVKHCVIASLSPAADERTNAAVKTRLSKMVDEGREDWCEQLDEVCWAIRSKCDKSSKLTPYEVMFLRKPKIPAESCVDGAEDDSMLEEPAETSQVDNHHEVDHIYATASEKAAEGEETDESAEDEIYGLPNKEAGSEKPKERPGFKRYNLTNGILALGKKLKQDGAEISPASTSQHSNTVTLVVCRRKVPEK